MWYHYLTLLVGIYMVANGIYKTVVYGNHGVYDWTVFGINMLIGLGILWWSWSGISTPVVPAYVPATGMMGGRRRYRR